MLGFLLAALPLVTAVDAMTGHRLPIAVTTVRASDDRVSIEANGSSLHYADFHGEFRDGSIPWQIRLTKLSRDEEQGLDRVNAFRARFGLEPLFVDENLTEAARYWAHQERLAAKVGHTCAALGNPAGCIEFNRFYHALPGVAAQWSAGQNAAFDTLSTWLAPEALFEAEEAPNSSERGHYFNLVNAQHWIGLGEAMIPGYGAYFAMNLM